MDWKSALFGKGAEMKAMPTMSPEQQSLFQQLLGGLSGQGAGTGPMGQGMSLIQQLLGGGGDVYEKPAMRQFNEQIIPGIAERFTGMGAGAQGSSAFGQQLGQAGAGLAENLAQQRAGLQQQGLSQLMQMLGMGIQTPTFQWQQMPGTQGAIPSLMSALGQGAGMMGGMMGAGWLGNKMGMMGGGQGLGEGQMYTPGYGIQSA